MNQTIRQSRAMAAYRAQQNQRLAERRKRRIEAMRQKLMREFMHERSGWLFAAAVIGIAFGALLFR